MTRDVFVCEAVRTAVGRAGGALAGTRPDDLAAVVVRAAVERCTSLDPADIDDVWFGDANVVRHRSGRGGSVGAAARRVVVG